MDILKSLDKNGNKSCADKQIRHKNSDDERNCNNAKKEKIFPYPACWKDDERMGVLFSPFRIREVNPENYDAKMKFWQDMILLYCTFTGTAIFSELSLQIAFARGENLAYGLGNVIDELLRLRKIRLRSEYEYDPINTWRGWAMNGLVWRPLAWGVDKLKATILRTDNENTKAHIEYIHLEAIQKFCKELETKVLEPKKGSLMHFLEFQKLVTAAQIELTVETLNLCLHTLHSKHTLGLEYKFDNNLREIHIVKIPATTDPNGPTISEVDHAIHNLQMTQKNLMQQLEDAEEEIGNIEQKVRQLVKENKRQLAKTYLRKKRLLVKNHEKRSQALQNVEELLNSVDEARNHGEILDAYKIGSRALQNVLNTSGLKYDSVDEVIGEVREALETQREIQDSISAAPLSDSVLSITENDDLELELKNLVTEPQIQEILPTQRPNKQISVQSPRQITITDTELLAMLDDLEVEDNSLKNSNRSPRDQMRE